MHQIADDVVIAVPIAMALVILAGIIISHRQVKKEQLKPRGSFASHNLHHQAATRQH